MPINIEERKQESHLQMKEYGPIAILFLPIFFVTLLVLLLAPNEPVFKWIFTSTGLFVILGFDVIWVIIIKLWNFRKKVFLTMLFFSVSVAIFISWLIIYALGYLLKDMW